MRLPRFRFTVRRMIVGVAMAGMICAAMAWAGRELGPDTPEAWARRRSASFLASARNELAYAAKNPESAEAMVGLARSGFRLAGYYSELAEGYAITGDAWREGTSHGPYSDILAAGQPVIVRCAAMQEGRGGGKPEGGFVAAGSRCVVVKDGAGDEDDCSDLRLIEVEIAEGRRRGQVVSIWRGMLRRR
jgi:hypothetical protein